MSPGYGLFSDQSPGTAGSSVQHPRAISEYSLTIAQVDRPCRPGSRWLSELDLWRTATMAGSRSLRDLALGYAYRCSGAKSGVSEKWLMSRAEAPVR